MATTVRQLIETELARRTQAVIEVTRQRSAEITPEEARERVLSTRDGRDLNRLISDATADLSLEDLMLQQPQAALFVHRVLGARR
jgi:hypothetical protein